MNAKSMQRLVTQAREDPQFFHSLVFDTEAVIQDLDYLDRGSKAALVAMSPERVIGTITGEIVGWCDVTCTSSCGVTCNNSCGYTTNLEFDDMLGRFTNPYNPYVMPRRRFR